MVGDLLFVVFLLLSTFPYLLYTSNPCLLAPQVSFILSQTPTHLQHTEAAYIVSGCSQDTESP